MRYENIDTEGLNLIILKLLERFLIKHFPVKRIKDGEHFKRGIIIPSYFTNLQQTHFFLTPGEKSHKLYSTLYQIMKLIFSLSDKEITNAIYRYLYLK